MNWYTVRGVGRGRGGCRTVGAICLFALFLPGVGGFALEEKEVVEPGKATFHEHSCPSSSAAAWAVMAVASPRENTAWRA